MAHDPHDLELNLAWLVVGTINEHFPHPDDVEVDPIMGTSGCIVSCGPCGALHALSLTPEGRYEVECKVELTGFNQGGWSYWNEETGKLRWDWFREFWAGHKGCASSNGVVEPCIEPVDE